MNATLRRPGAAILVLLAAVLTAGAAAAADQWIEVKSAHFTVTSNAGKGATATVAWQLEQVRSELAVIWPWAQVDLNRPLAVFAVKDEASLKNLAPVYWEKKNNIGAASVWVSNYDRTFIALRTDVEEDAKRHVNPYASSYFAYVSLILQQSVPRRLPPWFSRGLAAVMSNTVIQDANILVGPPAPWYLETLHGGPRIPLADLVAAREGSPVLKGDNLHLFDAQAWALVHYLMFADKGAHSAALGRFANLVIGGTDPDVAFREALGPIADLQLPLSAYVDRSIFAYLAVRADATVKREAFAVTPIPAAEAAARRALFHAAMRRPVEARAAIEDAKKAGGAADAELAEALLLYADAKTDAARAAYARAVDAGSADPYAHYRFASLLWAPTADQETLTHIRALLVKAVALNPRYAAAYDFLAGTNAQLGIGEPSALALRAVSLEPSNAHHRLTAARLLAQEKHLDEALKQVQAAAELADSAALAQEAAELRSRIERAKGGGTE